MYESGTFNTGLSNFVLSKAVVLFWLINCLSLLPLFVGGVALGLCFVIYSALCNSSFAIILMGKREPIAVL